MTDLSVATAEGSEGVLSKPRLPFVLVNRLLYHIKPNGLRVLYVPYTLVKIILSTTYDEKYHFGKERMLYDLSGLSIHRKLY